jgi:hypothetical protein
VRAEVTDDGLEVEMGPPRRPFGGEGERCHRPTPPLHPLEEAGELRATQEEADELRGEEPPPWSSGARVGCGVRAEEADGGLEVEMG